MEYRLSVQCPYPGTGELGCFIHDTNGVAVTQRFRDLAETFPWMRQNGWKLDEHVDGAFVPWRVTMQ